MNGGFRLQIDITYRAQANTSISTKRLQIGAYTNANMDVIWACSTQAVPAGATLATGSVFAAASATAPAQYLPIVRHA